MECAFRYAVHQELSGKSPDLMEVMNLDDGGKSTPEPVETTVSVDVRQRVLDAGAAVAPTH